MTTPAAPCAVDPRCSRTWPHTGHHDQGRLDEQVKLLQKEYDDWEAGVKSDMGDQAGEEALDAGAWVDGARQVADFAGPEISQAARAAFLRTHGLSPRGELTPVEYGPEDESW